MSSLRQRAERRDALAREEETASKARVATTVAIATNTSVRTRRDIQESQARSEETVARPKEHVRSGYVPQAVPMERVRDRRAVEALSKPLKTEAELDADRRIAAHSAQVDARLAHEREVWREQQEAPIREAKAELARRVAQKKAAAAKVARDLMEEMCADVLAGLTEVQAREVADIVTRKYSGVTDPTAWEFARAEWDQRQNELRNARAIFDKLLLADIEGSTNEELAQRLNCSAEIVKQLRAELY